MARIISGKAKNITLDVPKSGTRPITDMAKSAVFSMIFDLVKDANVLDLFAGSGSLGIEALSRGAQHATFVDSETEAVECIRKNLEKTKLSKSVTIHQAKAEEFCNTELQEKFNIIFLDPPYSQTDKWDLNLTANCLDQEGVIIFKHSPQLTNFHTTKLQCIDSRSYGQNVISFYTWK